MSVEGILRLYGLQGTAEPYGNGHINVTYRIKTGSSDYILQKINKNVFKDPAAVMRNVNYITDFLRQKGRVTLSLFKALDGRDYVEYESDIWRVYNFIGGSLCLDCAESLSDFRESGAAFGKFQRDLSDFDASLLFETIPRFHDTPNRYAQLKEAVEKDVAGRLKDVAPELEFAMAREEYAQTLVRLQKEGVLPLRVTHNDTKLNNILFDKNTRKALCVIDLDTVMPGLAVNDFGDAIRFGASTAAEDEQDLSKVSFSLALFAAFAQGYLSSCDLTDVERAHLCDGAKMMTLECGIRFLADHLNGDTYFRTARPNHNLDRCRTQFKLVAEMERYWDDMQKIIEEC